MRLSMTGATVHIDCRRVDFEKWQALGNDYVILEADKLDFELTPGRIRKLCAAHTGVFADGILLLSAPDEPGYVARLQIFNPDGSESELSGNGAREAVLYLRRRGRADSDTFSIQTAAGEIRPTISSPTTASLDLGRARLHSADYPSGSDDGRGELETGGRRWRIQHVQVGNPQCAIRVAGLPELERLDLSAIGPGIEHHELFPNRTNVSWYTAVAPGAIRARIFERGVGETSASGTGATGAAVPIEGERFGLHDGAVVIAAITSCTNTANAANMMAAGLLARNAVARGLRSKPWVKTSLVPGSQVTADVLERAGLQPALDTLGFHIAGFGCTTCNGGSGPLPERIVEAIERESLVTTAVLSGNRNFEGRIHPNVRAAYLASPALVVAYALAGSLTIDVTRDPLGEDPHGRPVYLRDIWPRASEISAAIEGAYARDLFVARYADLYDGGAPGTHSRWTQATGTPGTPTAPTSASRRSSTA